MDKGLEAKGFIAETLIQASVFDRLITTFFGVNKCVVYVHICQFENCNRLGQSRRRFRKALKELLILSN